MCAQQLVALHSRSVMQSPEAGHVNHYAKTKFRSATYRLTFRYSVCRYSMR